MALGAPTFASATGQLIQVMECFSDLQFSDLSNFTTNLDVVQTGLDGDYAAGGLAVLKGVADTLASPFGARAEAYGHWLLEIGRTISSNRQDAQGILDDLHRYMITNSQTFNDRNWTRGAISAAGGNTGNGTVYRILVDADGNNLQGGIDTTVRYRIVQDENTGALENQARAEVLTEGVLAGNGLQTETAFPGRATMLFHSAEDSVRGFRNPSFATYNSAGSTTTKFNGWTLSAAGDFTSDTSNLYRAEVRSGTARSLKITATGTATQKIDQRIPITNAYPRGVPYFAALAYNRAVNGDAGTLILRMGSHSVSVVLAAQTGWNLLTTLDGASDENSYPKNFTEDELDIQIDWTRTGGTGLLIGEVFFGPMIPDPNGCYVLPWEGSTGSLLEDAYTFTDSAATRGVSYEFTHTYGITELPTDNAGAETLADF